MRRFVQASLLVLFLGFFPGVLDARGACGTWRGDVKTLTDSQAMSVNFTSPPSTVETLGHLARPSTLGAHTPRLAEERRAYRVRAKLLEMKQEADGDFHIVLQGTSGATMIAQIPDPACAVGSPQIVQLRTARRGFVSRFGHPDTQRFQPVPGQPTLTVYGVLFFDEIHNPPQHGAAPNGAELHPVTAIK